MFQTTDYRVAGFLHARGVPWRGTEFNQRREMVFKFEDKNGVATSTANQYPKSPEVQYDDACRMFASMAKAASIPSERGERA